MDKFSKLSDFDKGQVVMAIRLGLSISKAAALVGCPRSVLTPIYQKWSKEELTKDEEPENGKQLDTKADENQRELKGDDGTTDSRLSAAAPEHRDAKMVQEKQEKVKKVEKTKTKSSKERDPDHDASTSSPPPDSSDIQDEDEHL